jgi:hypothetical protein
LEAEQAHPGVWQAIVPELLELLELLELELGVLG